MKFGLIAAEGLAQVSADTKKVEDFKGEIQKHQGRIFSVSTFVFICLFQFITTITFILMIEKIQEDENRLTDKGRFDIMNFDDLLYKLGAGVAAGLAAK
jgi:hypothetical protein